MVNPDHLGTIRQSLLSCLSSGLAGLVLGFVSHPPAKALPLADFFFTSPGAQLDTDTIRDLLVRPGQVISFSPRLIDGYVRPAIYDSYSVDYRINWDRAELRYDMDPLRSWITVTSGFTLNQQCLTHCAHRFSVVNPASDGISDVSIVLDRVVLNLADGGGPALVGFGERVRGETITAAFAPINQYSSIGTRVTPGSGFQQVVDVQTSVPVPLPALGFAAALGTSRKLKKRLKPGRCQVRQDARRANDGASAAPVLGGLETQRIQPWHGKVCCSGPPVCSGGQIIPGAAGWNASTRGQCDASETRVTASLCRRMGCALRWLGHGPDPRSASLVERRPGEAIHHRLRGEGRNDGTLWAEQPLYVQLLFALDRVKVLAPLQPHWQGKEPFASLLKGDMTRALAGGEQAILDIVMATHAGHTTEEFEAIVKDWIASARHPTTHRPYTEIVYQPILELLAYLRANGFKTFIISGGGIEFMRPWAETVYGIPPEQVIGSSVKVTDKRRDGRPVLVRLPELDFFNDREGKPMAIHQFIGRRPIAALGHSDGVLAMFEWTTAGQGPRFALVIHHTDAAREWAYDRESSIGRLSKSLDAARVKGWTVVDMKQDWKVIFPPQ